MDSTVREYLKQDRQWRREQRIAHAELQLQRASDDRREFWQSVLDALK